MKKLKSIFVGTLILAVASFFTPTLNAGASSEDWIECESMLIFDLPNPLEEGGPTMLVCFRIWGSPANHAGECEYDCYLI